MSTDEVLHLDNLPMDIIRLIVRSEEPLSMDKMRLISPRWNSAVLQRPIINFHPIIHYLRWETDDRGMHFKVLLEDRYRAFLGIESWPMLRFAGTDTVKAKSRNWRPYTQADEKGLNRVIRFLNRCWRVRHLKLNMDVCSNAFASLERALATTDVEEMEINGKRLLGSDSEAAILRVIKAARSPIRCLILSSEFCDPGMEEDPNDLTYAGSRGQFFCQAAKVFSKIVIRSHDLKDSEQNDVRPYWTRVETELNNTGQLDASLALEIWRPNDPLRIKTRYCVNIKQRDGN